MTVTATPETTAAAVEEMNDLGEHRSLWADVWRQFRRHKGAMAGLGLFSFITLAVIIGPFRLSV